jgi:hypothetical protein
VDSIEKGMGKTVDEPTNFKRKIKVTEKHVENGVRSNSGYCMIAEAIKEQVPEARRVQADMNWISFTYKGYRMRCMTPNRPAAALANFDLGEAIAPFDFWLHSPIITRRTESNVPIVRDAVGELPATHEVVNGRVRRRNSPQHEATAPDARNGVVFTTQKPPRYQANQRAFGRKGLRLNRELGKWEVSGVGERRNKGDATPDATT